MTKNIKKLEELFFSFATPEEKLAYELKKKKGTISALAKNNIETKQSKDSLEQNLVSEIENVKGMVETILERPEPKDPEIPEVTGEEMVVKINALPIESIKQVDFIHIKGFPWQEVKRMGSGENVGFMGYGAYDLNIKAITLGQITANQNNYATGLGSWFRISSDAARDITGFENGTDGRGFVLTNVGSFNITLVNQSALSAASNRIVTGTGTDIVLLPDDDVWLLYDTTTERWRVVMASVGAGTIDGSGTANELPYWVDANTLGTLAVATYPSLTELSYVKGVTSAIQTQFTGKLATGLALLLTGGTMTGGIVNSTSINPLTTIAESWIGPSSTTGIYFKSGNVGIGTTVPIEKLQVAGGAVLIDNTQYYKAKRADGAEINLIGIPVGGGISLDPSGQRITIGDGINATGVVNPFTTAAESWIGPSSTAGIYFKSGNVGIGTTGPATKLHLFSSDISSPFIRLENQANTSNPIGLSFYRSRASGADSTGVDDIGQISAYAMVSGAYSEQARIAFEHEVGQASNTRDIAFYTNNNAGTMVDRMHIGYGGNVGIGTTAPGIINGVDITSQKVLQVYSTTLDVRGSLEGGNGAALDLVDRGATANQKWAVLALNSQKVFLSSVNDAGSLVYNFLVGDLSTGNVGIGTTDPAAGNRLDIDGGNLVFHTDNTYDIGVSGATRPRSLFLGTNATIGGVIIESTDTKTGAGAVSITKTTTKYTTAGVGDALTLADGVDGQIKRIILDVRTGGTDTAILTPTTKTGYTTVTFATAGQSVTLQFVTTRGWIVVGSFGVIIS